MVENVGCCCGLLQTCSHRSDPEKNVIEGTFEIDHSPWLCLSAAGRSVAIRIYSSEIVDPSTGKGKESENTYLGQGKALEKEKLPNMKGKMKLPTKVIKFKLKFEVVRDFGIPGAFVVENRDKHEFFLKSATLKYTKKSAFPDDREFRFYCSSWVYPFDKTEVKRVFFINQLYIPRETPVGLKELRQRELLKLRGGSKAERKPWDRIYEYDCYNDLGDPDNGGEYARPVLGGSEYPYPRRLRTGRRPCQNDHSAESRPAGCFQIYVPPDERLSHDKQEELRNNFVDALVRFLAPKSNRPPWLNQDCPDLVKKIVHFFVPTAARSLGDFKFILSLVDFFKRKPNSSSHQDTRSSDFIEDIEEIFADKQVTEMEGLAKQKLEKLVPHEIFNQVVDLATKIGHVNSQLPSIIAEVRLAWTEEKEFGRQMLAGTNPVRIQLLKKFIPLRGTRWEPEILDRLHEAMKEDKAFILEHHDYLLPFLKMINGKGVCAYATRTILEARSTLDTIEPIAIELSLPDDSINGSMVVFPDDYIRWELAKIHVAANDAAYHQLVSHWLHTHAVVEPFIIATRRHLSVMHPIHRLLDPHFKDTLHINALARAIFLNAGGILERTLFTGEFSMRLSSHLYKQWRFEDQALPKDLQLRGMAVEAKESIIPEIVSVIKTLAEMERETTDDEEQVERDENLAEIDVNVVESDENLTEIDENLAEIDENVVESDENMAEIDENVVESDENLAEIDENVVESDENPVTDNKTPDEKVKFPAGVKLILEDYPYAKDGTEIWGAIETWVRDYCNVFYEDDYDVMFDGEIQEWWSEIREEGHGDQSEGWYDLRTLEDLVRALTTLIWMTSGLHAAVNFGQYAYAGWPPNRPMLLRKFIPKPFTKEYEELDVDPDKFMGQMLPEKFQMAFVIAVMDLLSRHTSDEVYLGQRPPENKWEENAIVDKKFQEFRRKLEEIEKNIKERNKQYELMNRWGYSKIPYKLLYPDTSKTKAPKEKGKQPKMDINERGIPNSISM